MHRKVRQIIEASDKDPDSQEVVEYLEEQNKAGQLDRVLKYIRQKLGVSIDRSDYMDIMMHDRNIGHRTRYGKDYDRDHPARGGNNLLDRSREHLFEKAKEFGNF